MLLVGHLFAHSTRQSSRVVNRSILFSESVFDHLLIVASLDGFFIPLDLAIRAKDCIQVPADLRQVVGCLKSTFASGDRYLGGRVGCSESYRIDGAPTLCPTQDHATNADFFSIVSCDLVFH